MSSGRREPHRDRTLAAEGRGEHHDRGSRFLGFAFPIAGEAAFQARLAELRAEHAKARHHCWAWRAGQAHRFNDDGEPGGTAGRPIYQVIEGEQLVQSAIVVVRYFGGVKLGTGGLVRAYTAAAQRAVAAAEARDWVVTRRLDLFLPFELLGLREELEARLPQLRWLEESFREDGWSGCGELPETLLGRLEALLEERGRGRARWNLRGTPGS